MGRNATEIAAMSPIGLATVEGFAHGAAWDGIGVGGEAVGHGEIDDIMPSETSWRGGTSGL